MTTIEKINMDGVSAIEKLKRGESLTKDEMKCIKIYNDLHSDGKRAFNSGKRTAKKHNKNW